MRLSDTALGLMVLAAGLALGWYAWNLPPIPGQNYGAATFPLAIAGGLVVCAATLLAQGLRRGAAPGPRGAPPLWLSNPRGVLGVAGTALLVVFYMLAARRLGFIPTAVIITFAMFLILRVPAPKALLISVVAAFAVDFMFRSMLLVPLPFGILPRLPW